MKIVVVKKMLNKCAAIMLAILAGSLPGEAQTTSKKSAPLPTLNVRVQPVAENVQAPTVIVFPDNNNLWIAEQTGKIKLYTEGKPAEAPILDLKTKMVKVRAGYDERGLLGLALHPQFRTNKKFYVYYSAPSSQGANHTSVIAEYTAPATNQTAAPDSGRILLTIEEPEANHNGGCLQFGPDGYLYIGVGDGGGQRDRHGEIGNGQNLNTLLGKILRIDVNAASGYNIPKGNPFAGRADAKPEIWAYGFRNPWRFSFDKVTGQLFAGDVGQNMWEEIDIVTKGGNYGWRITEGMHCHMPDKNCKVEGLVMPIAEYPHQEGVSVTGGYVYAGKTLTYLKSRYIFADWNGPVFYLQRQGDNWSRGRIQIANMPEGAKITSFGQDSSGEIYVLTNPETGPDNNGGVVYKIVKK